MPKAAALTARQGMLKTLADAIEDEYALRFTGHVNEHRDEIAEIALKVLTGGKFRTMTQDGTTWLALG